MARRILGSLSPILRNRIARIFLLIGILGPGIALAFFTKIYGSSPLFAQMESLPIISLQMWGFILVISAVLVLIRQTRDVGYTIVAIFYFVAMISGGAAIANGHGNSALIFTLPVLLWLYLEAALTSQRQRESSESSLLSRHDEIVEQLEREG